MMCTGTGEQASMASVHRTILIALALAAPLAAQTTPEDPPPAIVEGSVINIQNSRTIPRATVTLLHLKGTGSKSQRADGSGHFMFKNVEPGIYRLMAERQGFFSDDRKRAPEHNGRSGQTSKSRNARHPRPRLHLSFSVLSIHQRLYAGTELEAESGR